MVVEVKSGRERVVSTGRERRGQQMEMEGG